MKNIFKYLDASLLFRVNLAALIITAISEFLTISMFINKAFIPEIERWRFLALLFGLILVSILFLISLLMFFYFLRIKKREMR